MACGEPYDAKVSRTVREREAGYLTGAVFLVHLSLPVLAGKLNLPALNSAISWKPFDLLAPRSAMQAMASAWEPPWAEDFNRTQSAENLQCLDVRGNLRDYTPKSVYYVKSANYYDQPLNNDAPRRYFTGGGNKEYTQPNNLNPSFCSYLAGLIEGDGTIIVPSKKRSDKGRLNYPSIQMAFDLRDLPLAILIQKELKHGSLSRTKGVNAYRLTINNYEGLVLMVNILNGYMRTPKIEMLYLLIDFLHNRFPDLNLTKKDKDLSKTRCNSNEWLAGFIDADGHFFVNATKSSISCGFELVQSSVNKLGLSKKDIMISLSNYLNVKLGTASRKKYPDYLEYRVRTSNLESNLILISYLKNNNLFSSKYLNYLDWICAIDLIAKNKHKDLEGKDQLRIIRDGMNNKRTHFNWDHLQNFHNLYR